MSEKELTEKYYQIINVSLMLFSKLGYQKTAIDNIIQKANVSKGLFYYHFKNKKELYIFLYEQAAKEILDKIDAIVRQNPGDMDVFDFLYKYIKVQFELSLSKPYLFQFIYAAEKEEDENIKSSIQQIENNTIKERNTFIINNLNYSRLNKEINIEMAIDIMSWVVDGYMNKTLLQNEKFDKEAYQRFVPYIEFMKKCLYS